MKKFKYNHSIIIYVLLSAILVATVLGGYFSIISALNSIETFKTVAFIVLFAVDLFLLISVLSILLYSNYQIKKGVVKLSLGIFSAKYKIDQIVSLTNIIDVKKLVVNLSNGEFFFVVISPDNFHDFVMSVKENNPEAVFDVGYTEPKK